MKRLLALGICSMLAACAGERDYGPPPSLPPLRSNDDMRPYHGPASIAPVPPTAHREAYQPGPIPKVASAGPLTTAMVGDYMDRQEADFRRALHGMGVLVARPGDEIVINLRSDALFDGAEPTVTAQRILASIAPVLRHYDHTQVYIDAFTDTAGSADQNLSVSRKRAYTLGGVLVRNGVPLSRIQARGYGEENLKITTGDHVNEPRNRRIEIRDLSTGGGIVPGHARKSP